MSLIQRLRDRINPPKSEREKRLGPKPLILAQNAKHAEHVAHYLGLRPYEYEYAGSAVRMHGRYGGTIYVYDTLEWRNDRDTFIDLLEMAAAIKNTEVVIITEQMIWDAR